MSGPDIAAEIAAALIEAGEEVGTGAYTHTIRRVVSAPTDETGAPTNPFAGPAEPAPAPEPELFEVTGIEGVQDVRDMTGTLVGVQRRTLTINATGVTPLKSDRIAVGVARGDVVSDTVFEEILAVKPLAPGGTALLYELQLSA